MNYDRFNVDIKFISSELIPKRQGEKYWPVRYRIQGRDEKKYEIGKSFPYVKET